MTGLRVQILPAITNSNEPASLCSSQRFEAQYFFVKQLLQLFFADFVLEIYELVRLDGAGEVDRLTIKGKEFFGKWCSARLIFRVVAWREVRLAT